MSIDDLLYAQEARRYVAKLPGDMAWLGVVSSYWTPEHWAQFGRDLVAGQSPLLALHPLEVDE